MPVSMPRPRFTLRRLMIAVAVASAMLGLGIEGDRLWKWRSRCLGLAEGASRSEGFYAGLALDIAGHPSMAGSQTVSAIVPRGAIRFRTSGGVRRVHYPMDSPEPADEATRRMLVERCEQAAAHYGALRRKYERAAWHPRRPIEPDPPGPD